MKKILFKVLTVFLIIATLTLPASAAGYNSYTYNSEGQVVSSPDPYAVQSVLTGIESGAGAYSAPSDICADEQGNLYIADTGNNRIVCLDKNGSFIKSYQDFILNGEITTLSEPSGVYIRDNKLYISDTLNSRILVSDLHGNVSRVLTKPQASLYPQNMAFSPKRISVDSRGNVYALCDGIYFGAVTYNLQGEFVGFFGCNTIEVTLSLITDYAWRKILNYEQRSQLDRYLPIEYSSIDVDSDNFMYVCTASGEKGGTIRKLNHKGVGVIDNATFYESGLENKNSYVDTVCDSRGFISGLDKANKRILQYDSEGNLLFVFGLAGGRQGSFTEPCAMTSYGESIYILDKTKSSVTQFVSTRFGAAVREATEYYNRGQFELAVEPWQEVLKINSGYQTAYLGIGKSLYFSGDYEQAAQYFKLADSKAWNSKAFKEIRALWLHDNFIYFITAAIAIVVALIILNTKRLPFYKKWHSFTDRLHYRGLPTERGKFALYSVFHPLAGFTELREKKRSSLSVAVVITVLAAVGMMVKVQYSGFRFNTFNSSTGSILTVGIGTVVILGLFVIANWALCVLFDSEAYFKDIICCTAYSLIPFVFSLYFSTALSFVLITEEAMIISLISGICTLWSVMLLFFSFKEIHQYTAGKTAISLVCTLIALVLVAFLLFMMFSLTQQMISFAEIAFTEILYRFS